MSDLRARSAEYLARVRAAIDAGAPAADAFAAVRAADPALHADHVAYRAGDEVSAARYFGAQLAEKQRESQGECRREREDRLAALVERAGDAAQRILGEIARDPSRRDVREEHADYFADIDAAERRRRLLACGVPELMLGIDLHALADWLPPRYVETADWLLRMIDDPTRHQGMLLGAPGVGKTALACGAIAHLFARGSAGRIVTATRLLLDVSDRFGGRLEALDRYARTPFLVIDEAIEAQARRDDEELLIAELLRVRHSAKRPTLLLANVLEAPAMQALSAGLQRRIVAEGAGIRVCDWPRLATMPRGLRLAYDARDGRATG